MTYFDTGVHCGVLQHDDGRLVIYRGTRDGTFIHIELNDAEKEALRVALVDAAKPRVG